MNIEELRAKRAALKQRTDATFNEMEQLANEAARVANVASNAPKILNDLDIEFANQTGLTKPDIAFLFIATALQCARIFIINKLTEIDKAGQGNKTEDAIHKFQGKVLNKFDNGIIESPQPYYAPLNQIITARGVPYDSTSYGTQEIKDLQIFKGANHRFSTLGHDPIIGLIFGTVNILTNTITCIKKPIITTYHVTYDADIKNPSITSVASTFTALKHAVERVKDDKKAIAAALIKQILHIGTDLFTTKGIHLPGANLVLSNTNVEKLTKYISTGDVVKAGVSAAIATFINFLISTLHTLMYDESKYDNLDVYSVKTKKIIMYSNAIATGSNVIWVGANMAGGNATAIKDLDFGGLIITIKRIINDTEYIRKIKEEFIYGKFEKLIMGEDI